MLFWSGMLFSSGKLGLCSEGPGDGSRAGAFAAGTERSHTAVATPPARDRIGNRIDCRIFVSCSHLFRSRYLARQLEGDQLCLRPHLVIFAAASEPNSI